jgi:hypothetical protein
MSKAEVTYTIKPSDDVVRSAVQPVTVVDAKGRKITLQKPGVLAQYRLIELLGDTASNQVYMGMVLPIIFVTAIDDEPVHRFTKRSELDALIQRLDEDGINAVMKGVTERFGAQDPESDKAALKN